MKKLIVPLLLCLTVAIGAFFVLPQMAAAEATGAVLVAADGTQTPTDNVLEDWAAGSYAYIKLGGDASFAMNGEDLIVDLAGYDLAVSGNGNISAFDTANDSYDPKACGTITNTGSVTFTEDVAAPNGSRYITVTDKNGITAHRLEIKLISVSLRTSAAGVYYKAQYNCDSVLAGKVRAYGVIASLDNMPGADFADDGEDVNRYTVAATNFKSGVTATSGSIFGIMKDARSALLNNRYARTPIYANPYIDLGNGPIVGDTVNPGKTVADANFDGIAMSLYDVMMRLDATYNNYKITDRLQLDNFYTQWKNKGMNWGFVNIGQTAAAGNVDNSDIELKFDEGTTNATCPVCQKKVTWTPIYDNPSYYNLAANETKTHYYLAEDVTYTGTSTFFQSTVRNKNTCFHLNGHNLTATKAKAFFGSNGRTNIMGNGIVTGYQGDSSQGAALMINNTVAGNGLYVYGGTYKKTENSHKNAAVAVIHTVGSIIQLYDDVTIDAGDSVAVRVATPTTKNAELLLFGCTVNGNVELKGADPTQYQATSTIEIVDCTINGNVTVGDNNTIYVSGSPVINSVSLARKARLTLLDLGKGTSIGIANGGTITTQSADVKDYVGYFYGINPAATISVKDNALHCKVDYTGNIEDKFAEGTTDAICPVCAKMVTWTPIYDDNTAYDLPETETKTHYYLAEDINYSGSSTFFQSRIDTQVTCFHLNGHDLTATKAKAFFGSNSHTNIMGSGIVTGYQSAPSQGAAMQINNNEPGNGLYVYGGTYRKTANSHKDSAVAAISTVGSVIQLFEDVTIEAEGSTAIFVATPTTKAAELGVYGSTVNGDVKLLGADPAKTQYSSKAELEDCTINGNVDIANYNDVSMIGAPVITTLTLHEDIRLNIEGLNQKASVGLVNEGIFTAETYNVSDYVDCFHGTQDYQEILCKDGALYCGPDYTGDIEEEFEEGTTDAICPVCKVKVTWTPVYKNATAYNLSATETKTHYYLAENVTFTGDDSTFFQSNTKNGNTCFHLNGHDLTTTKAKTFFGGGSRTNIMGTGIVTGHQSGAASGAALQVGNTTANNGLYVYGGTYRKTEDSAKNAVIACVTSGGSTINLYEDATLEAADGTAIYVHTPARANAALGVYGATVNGNVTVLGADPSKYTFTSTADFVDCTITGNVTVAANNAVTVGGQAKISKLNIAEGLQLTFEDMLEGSDITVSAKGIFSNTMSKAIDWVEYLTCAEEGDWIIIRDDQFYQGAKQTLTAATEEDQVALEAVYEGKTVKYGDFHGHAKFGNTTYSDGQKPLSEWLTVMDQLDIDFMTVSNHRQTLHMYQQEYTADRFLGGSEPGTKILDSKAAFAEFDFNMIMNDPEAFEEVLLKWNEHFRLWKENGYSGYRFNSPYGSYGFTTADFSQLRQDIYDAGGLLVLVHPKNIGYLLSENPLDYYFGEPCGMEICTGLKLSNGDGGNMCAPANEKAYRLWVDLLELGTKLFATAGSDTHSLPNTSGLNAVYTANDDRADYMAALRSGNTAPGWVGIRMNIGGTAMGGTTDFTGKRLQFSVGDMYRGDQATSDPVYEADHVYRVELYDDGGLLMEAVIDPTQMNYFAIDCDETARFYRVVVWDDTDATRVGVSNPIWNTTGEG